MTRRTHDFGANKRSRAVLVFCGTLLCVEACELPRLMPTTGRICMSRELDEVGHNRELSLYTEIER